MKKNILVILIAIVCLTTFEGCLKEPNMKTNKNNYGIIDTSFDELKPVFSSYKQEYLPEGNIANSLKAEIYPSPLKEELRSNLYRVAIDDGKKFTEGFVYEAEGNSVTYWQRGFQSTISYITFGVKDKTNVKVRFNGSDIKKIEISPKSKKIKATIQKDMAEFEVSKNDKLWIIINDDEANPLFIYADPPKPEVPKKGNVKYYPPGVHNIGQQAKIESDTTVYLDGGAYLIGNFDISFSDNVTITGPGVLSGECFDAQKVFDKSFEERMPYHMIVSPFGHKATNCRIERVTIVKTPSYVFSGSISSMYGIKVISPWMWSTDCFYLTPDLITNICIANECFAFVGDDVFFPRDNFMGNIIYKNCFASTGSNSIFEMSYWPANISKDNYTLCQNISVKSFADRAVFQLILDGNPSDSEKGTKNQYFENINIEGNINDKLFSIENCEYPWDRKPGSDRIGNSYNMKFKNITLEGTQNSKSTILGKDEKNGHHNYLFENIIINGEKINAENAKEFFEINEFTSNIVFK